MGNSFMSSASADRLVSATRDGDLVQANMLFEFNPSLANCSTFGGPNSLLHFVSSTGHNETALMHACTLIQLSVLKKLL
ncbi:RING-type E3 ubiquitin transferase [Ranunculus cassubicifolius]